MPKENKTACKRRKCQRSRSQRRRNNNQRTRTIRRGGFCWRKRSNRVADTAAEAANLARRRKPAAAKQQEAMDAARHSKLSAMYDTMNKI